MQGNQAGSTAEVTGSGDAGGAELTGHATRTDMAGKHDAIDVSLICSDVFL